jgi:CheY-like chemotaxis protein/anti-sigma regulatory factor (Ser/Thr protein kinase)
LTEQKRTYKLLEAESKAKSNFLATTSHEMRTPMNAILGIAEINLQKDLPEEMSRQFEMIHTSASNLLGLINDILDLSKIETGRLELNPSQYGAPDLINDAARLSLVRIGSKPIKLMLDIDETLPSKLLGDELRLKQILNNLLSNAVKYTKEGSVKLTVSHVPQNGGVLLRFVVEDTGQGMTQKDLGRLFTEYTRLNVEANREIEGTGLGLSITRQLVEMMDGTIEAASEYGRGSTFTVTLKQGAVPCQPIGREVAGELKTFRFRGKKSGSGLGGRYIMPYANVLVVDDSESNLYVAQGLLLPYKLAVETAYSGFEALELINSGKSYDIIFMDHMMPQMDGLETAKKLRKAGYGGVIVALTANALTGADEMFKQNGFDDYLSKPIDVHKLDGVLNTYVRDRKPDGKDARFYIGAAKYLNDTPGEETVWKNNRELIEVFRRDAEKAALLLRESVETGDMKLFATTAHRMKSALGLIGERELATTAALLERAGRDGDKNALAGNAGIFIENLEALIKKLTPQETGSPDADDKQEDAAFLAEQLRLIKAACEDYDADAAYAALDRLNEKKWKKETAKTLEAIRNDLFAYSDFDSAIKRAAAIMDSS